MSFHYRDVLRDDLDAIAELNLKAGVSVVPLQAHHLFELYRSACYFRVAVQDRTLAAFLIGTDAGAGTGNPGFHWFGQRHDRFLYIDRIVVSEPFRGHGLGRILYNDLISFAEARVPVVGCQVSLEPRDDASLLFHASLGFLEVAQLTLDNGDRIGVMERELSSFGYVREHYLENGRGLPDLPWLAARALPDPGAQIPSRRAG